MSDPYDDDGEQPEDGKKPDYEIGFGKPPPDYQFKRGQSGNPRGRPKGARGLKAELEEELRQRMVVTEGGKQIKVPKMRVAIKRMVNDALQGKPSAQRALFPLILQILGDGSEARSQKKLSAGDEAALLRALGFPRPEEPDGGVAP